MKDEVALILIGNQIHCRNVLHYISLVYACTGVLIAMLELTLVLLACVYSAQIGRRGRNMLRRTPADHHEECLPSMTSDYSSLPFHKE